MLTSKWNDNPTNSYLNDLLLPILSWIASGCFSGGLCSTFESWFRFSLRNDSLGLEQRFVFPACLYSGGWHEVIFDSGVSCSIMLMLIERQNQIFVLINKKYYKYKYMNRNKWWQNNWQTFSLKIKIKWPVIIRICTLFYIYNFLSLFIV